MTVDDLARIAEAIAADERQTNVSNWPLSRERTRAYLALAREVAQSSKLPPDVWFALAALAPASDAGAEAGEAGT